MNGRKRRGSRKTVRFFRRSLVAGMAFLLVALLFFSGKWLFFDRVRGTAATSAPSVSAVTTAKPASEVRRVRMMCAGDNLIHSSIYKQAAKRSKNGGYDFSYAYSRIEPILAGADFAVLNQETVIDPDKEPSTFPLFNSPPELGEEMIRLGFNVINHANNHVLDKGDTGELHTIDFWESHPGILLTGLYRNEEDLEEVKINTVNGIKFAHIGVTEYLNGLVLPASSPIKVVSLAGAGLSEAEFYATVKRMIAAARRQADVVCVSAHFKQENSPVPSDTQREIVDKLVGYGADVIIGTGPHVLQPIEFRTRSDGGKVLVMYSLGNLISAQDRAANVVSGIADVKFAKDLATGKTKIESAKLIPLVTHYGAGFRDIHLVPFADYTPALALAHGVRRYQTRFSYDYVSDLLKQVIGPGFLETH